MNTSPLLGFSASILLAAGLTGCAGGTGGGTATESPEAAPSESSTQAPSPSGTSSTSAAPTRTFTSEELAALVGQIKDAKGVPLTVMPAAELAANAQQAMKMLSEVVVAPAECQDLVLAANSAGSEGLSMALGTSVDSATGTAAGVSFATGMDPALLDKSVQTSALDKCRNVTVTTAGVTVSVVTSLVEGVGSEAGTVAYTTETTLPDGRTQSMLTAQATKNGVGVSVSGNGSSEEDAVTRVSGLMDQALDVLD